MTKAELIELLEGYDDDLPVLIADEGTNLTPIGEILEVAYDTGSATEDNGPILILECEFRQVPVADGEDDEDEDDGVLSCPVCGVRIEECPACGEEL